MNFKVGQRVRLIWQSESSRRMWGNYVGAEGVVAAIGGCNVPGANCKVRFDRDPDFWQVSFSSLAPLTPPNESDNEAARQFIERMKRIAHEPMPVKERA